MQHRRMQVVHIHGILRHAEPDLVGLAYARARANAAAADAQSIVSHVKTGKGTVGCFTCHPAE